MFFNRKTPVRKAIMPVAGLGTRFLPATKAMPKEMLTVVDKPVVQYVVEEAVAAGIEEIIFITGRSKTSIENHFDEAPDLVSLLEGKGKMKESNAVKNALPAKCRLIYTRQGQPKGLGHAIACAASIVGNEPCAVLLPDDILFTENGNPLADMIKLHEETGQSVVLAEEVPFERLKNYGILDLEGGIENNQAKVKGFVEKPNPEDAPSRLGAVGRYVLTPKHFEYLLQGEIGKGGEIQLTDAMAKVAAEEGYRAHLFDGKRFDCGDKVGFQMANLFFAMRDGYISERLLPFVQDIAQKHDRRG